MANLTLYRKYRSQTFKDLVGQEQVVRTLQNSLLTGRVAHAYLFTGPRGTGKTSTARIFAKALNCLNSSNGEPCNECESCKSILKGSCMDVVEMDAASDSSVDDVREAIVQVTEYKPTFCRYKVFIIDEVHDLSAKAFDAILKTIEEPPSHVIFILATTEYHKVPPTIRSRCQKFEFDRASLAELTTCLEYVLKSEGIEHEQNALFALAKMADGGFRDALTLLERVIITLNGPLTIEHVYLQLGLIHDDFLDHLLGSIKEGHVVSLLSNLDEIHRKGHDPKVLVEALLGRITELTRASYGIQSDTGDLTFEATLHASAANLGKEFLFHMRVILAEAHKTIRDITLPKIWLEAELVEFCERNQTELLSTNQNKEQSIQTPKTIPNKEKLIIEPSSESLNNMGSSLEASSNEILLKEQKVWKKVVITLSKISRLAEVKLEKTEVLESTSEHVVIGFERQLDLKWVINNLKIQAAIQKEWSIITNYPDIKFEYQLKPNQPNMVKDHFFNHEPVELPAKGEKLVQIAQDIFKNF